MAAHVRGDGSSPTDSSFRGPRRKAAGTMVLRSRRHRKKSGNAVRAEPRILATDALRRKLQTSIAPLSPENQARHSRYLRPTGPVSHHRSERKRCHWHPLPSARTSLHSLRWWLLPVPAQASYGLPGRAPSRKAHDHRRRTTLVRPEPERGRHALHEPTWDVARTGLEVVGAQRMGGAQRSPVADDRETFPQSALARGRPEEMDAYNDFLLQGDRVRRALARGRPEEPDAYNDFLLRATVFDEVEACLGAYSSSELRKVVV
ncbi:hypothetical protein HPB49_022159 [Dermacentor silvarum]|uniref:Uncharacterized protein n=1 Tax=Dermacentor silvarum TaxID=543639 RepID=A0ACB8E4A7_DERSI|nr:hypothetical protein HPB49_022159 [Dermacentor silvarum]